MGRNNLIKSNRKVIKEGIRDGIPIGLGYLAVSFSLGIAAKNAGLNFFQSFLASLLCNASAGEYSGFTVIAADATYFEMAVVTLIANARYLLMSCALSQRMKSSTSLIHRLLLGFYITDEFFNFPKGECESVLYLWCNPLCRAMLGGWYGARHDSGQCFAAQGCKRFKRGIVRNVSCHYCAAHQGQQTSYGHCNSQLYIKPCLCVSACNK